MKKLSENWIKVIPEDNKKYFKAASNIINCKPHVQYIDDLGSDSKINLQFLMNITEMIVQANSIGEEELKKYKQTGESPSNDLYSKKVEHDKINKMNTRENERREERKQLDSLFEQMYAQLRSMIDSGNVRPPKAQKGLLPLEKTIINYCRKHFDFIQKWNVYWYKESKDL